MLAGGLAGRYEPMLATPWEHVFTDEGWSYELKWDGVRCVLSSESGHTVLRSRAGNDMTDRYPEIGQVQLASDLVLDGEIVVLDAEGRPSFELLQGRMNLQRVGSGANPAQVTYVVFDLIHNRESLIDQPVEDRYLQLRELDLPTGFVVPDRFTGNPSPIWEFVVNRELEGIVAKRLGSAYQPGVRSADWRKISHFKQVRAIVGGFTPGTGGRTPSFGALLLGIRDGDELRWVGSVGSGFDNRTLGAVRSALDEMVTGSSPFAADAELPAEATWVEPHLVAVVRYKQWTRAGRLRAPSFKGFSDVPATAVTWAEEGPAAGVSRDREN